MVSENFQTTGCTILKCACVGGSSNVPLGFVSLTENVMMLGMGIWMLIKVYG